MYKTKINDIFPVSMSIILKENLKSMSHTNKEAYIYEFTVLD